MSKSRWPHGLYRPWNSPGQNTGVSSLSLFQGNLPNPGIEPRSPASQADSLPAEPLGKPKNTGVGSLSLFQGNLPNPGIEPRSPASQADSLPAEPLEKPKNTGVGSLSLLQRIFPTQGSNWGLLHCRWILYQLSYQGSPDTQWASCKCFFFIILKNTFLLMGHSCGTQDLCPST